MSNTHTGRMPRQIPYIIANEGCERFSFYGMRNILTPFLISTLLLFIPVLCSLTTIFTFRFSIEILKILIFNDYSW